jgi:hypothetical protein
MTIAHKLLSMLLCRVVRSHSEIKRLLMRLAQLTPSHAVTDHGDSSTIVNLP